MTTQEILRAAKSLIENQEHHAADRVAQDASGRACEYYDKCAVRWCAYAAIAKTCGFQGGQRGKSYYDAIYSLREACSPNLVTQVNRNHAAIISAFDKAIASAANLPS